MEHRLDGKRYVLDIPDLEYMRARFDNWDYMLLRDCEGEGRTIADALLALETIARRIEQSNPTGTEPE